MRLHRFYISPETVRELTAGSSIELTEEKLVHQLKDVFRLEVEDRFMIFNGTGLEVEVKITHLSKKSIYCEILKNINGLVHSDQLPRQITLAFALLKGEHTEMVLEKCTELGVTTFQPLITDRTVKTGFRKDRCKKIITEATEQSGWSTLPSLQEPTSLKVFLENQKNLENIFVMNMDGESIANLFAQKERGAREATVLIGPEGGWSDEERNLFKDLNLQTFSLGKQTLRAETACIASVTKLIEN